jgi:hypothetical protein
LDKALIANKLQVVTSWSNARPVTSCAEAEDIKLDSAAQPVLRVELLATLNALVDRLASAAT